MRAHNRLSNFALLDDMAVIPRAFTKERAGDGAQYGMVYRLDVCFPNPASPQLSYERRQLKVWF